MLVRLLWLRGIGLVLFVALNSTYDARLALVVGIAGLFAGLATCAFSYLVSERATRQIARHALEDGPPEHPAVPGVTTRIMLTWALSTGAPVLGVALIGGGVVLGILPGHSQQLALSMMGICGVALWVGLQAMFLVARSIADPVKTVREGLARVGRGDLTVVVPVFDASDIGMLQAGFNETRPHD